MAVIFVAFSDALPTTTVQQAFNSISPSTENYLKAVSYGKLTLQFVPTYQWFQMSKPTTEYMYAYAGSPYRFVGEFSMMGFHSGRGQEMFAWERWLLGWLDDSQVICQPTIGSGTVKLTPVEQANGIKMLVVPTGTGTAVVVESRRAIGYDSRLPESGVLVYSIDTRIPWGAAPLKCCRSTTPTTSRFRIYWA